MLKLIILSSLLAAPALAASTSDWQSRSIYQLLTDRFATSDGSSPSCNTADRKYCGGTWRGIINRLDYIQNMGFDAIWISPVVKNLEGETAYGEAFHGYWQTDINSLNPHFGTADDLKALAQALHDRNMYLMVDVVVNHMAGNSDPPSYSSFSPFGSQNQYHKECFIQASDYDNNQTAVEQCWLGDSKVPLVDVNTEDDGVVSTFNTWIKRIVSDYSVDGIRIDTVKHVRKDFWPAFNQAAGVYAVGEVLHNETSYVAEYTDKLDAVLDYPTWFTLFYGFASSSGNLSALASTVQASQSTYKNGEFHTGSFLENHDQPRFASQTQDLALIKNAMTWPFVGDSVPILYYGQEQEYTGGADPANREALWLSGYDENKPLVSHVKALNAARKAAATANKDFYTTAVKFLSATNSNLAISKPPMLALLANTGNSSNPQWSVSNAGYSANEELVDVLTCTKFNADGNGAISVQGSGGNPQVILPASALAKGGSLCPQVATGQVSSASGLLTALPWSSAIAAALIAAKLLA